MYDKYIIKNKKIYKIIDDIEVECSKEELMEIIQQQNKGKAKLSDKVDDFFAGWKPTEETKEIIRQGGIKLEEDKEISNYEKHAIREFEYAGWLKDGKYDDEMQELICTQVLDLLHLFAKHGHSGSSYKYAINLFKTLASFEPISSIKCTDDEWEEVGNNSYQNKRLSSVFKEGKDGKPYYLYAIVFKGEDRYDTFTGTIDGITSRQNIKLPFMPKTFYIDVIREKIDESDDDYESKDVVVCGDGSYVYSIKDRKQLEEVAKYYDMSGIL